MAWEEEVIELLREIKEQLKRNQEEWQKAVVDSKVQQQKVMEEAQKAKKSTFRQAWGLIGAVVVLFFVFGAGQSLFWQLSRWFTRYEYNQQSFLQNGNYYEAKDWLDRNQSGSPLASNRFGVKENALKFVNSLYQAGAEGVYVVNITDDKATLKDEGDPYADSLVVKLPIDKAKRKKLFEIYAEESKREGFNSASDFGQKELFFWWD